MTERSRLEINIRRLLRKCEFIAKEDSEEMNWRLEKYVEGLQEMVENLQASSMKPTRDVMFQYIKRVEFLKAFIRTKKLTNPIERAVAAQMLPANIVHESTGGPSITAQIHKKTAAKCSQEMRDELFRSTTGNELRQRLNRKADDNEDVNAVLKHNRDLQEKIAENMISMTQSIKEHALTANKIIKKDLQMLEKSEKLTDQNTAKLKSESLKLEEHTKSTWRCWLWLMIAFVIVVFFNMVLLMKVAKKKIE